MAPAGYGKSTQVRRWVLEDDRRVRWLDLEPIDNDPLVLAHVVARGLTDRAPSDIGDVGPGGAELDDLAELIATPAEPFVLVMDDVHNITSAESAGLVHLIIDRLPAHSTLILVGRSQPLAASTARHRLAPGIVDVTADDLAFDLAETEEMLNFLDIRPDLDVISTIAEQFEGWPAGLRLAGQVLATRRSGIEIPIDRLGDLGDVTDYLTEEWFGALDGDDQIFLTEIGGLGRFTGPQCDEVLRRHDSASRLRHLCRDEMMLIGLDQHDEWYRMHAVLARWLSARLRSSDPARWREIQVAAAAWWSQRGDIDLAVDHAAAANDLELLERLVLEHSGPYAARGMYRTLERWLEHLDEARVRYVVPLEQVKALVSVGLGDGERALGWTRRCQSGHASAGTPPSGTDAVVALRTAVLVGLLEDAPASVLLPGALQARRDLPPGEWRTLAGLVLGANMYLCGQNDAIHRLRESLFESETTRSTTLQAVTAAVLAIVVDLDGTASEAAELSDRVKTACSPPHWARTRPQRR